MASEASKIRNQCAKKYGVREKQYKETISELRSSVSELESKLEDYDNMRREYLKLCVFMNLSDEDKKAVLSNVRIETEVDTLLGAFGIKLTSLELSRSVTSISRKSDDSSLVDHVSEILAKRQKS